MRERREVQVGDERPGVVACALVGGVDRVQCERGRAGCGDGGQGRDRRDLRVGVVDDHGPRAVRVPVGGPVVGAARRPVDRPDLSPRVGGHRGRVEGRVLDVVAHRADVVGPHRLDVHQRTAVVEVELAVPRVVHGVAEVHELRRRSDVELQPLEDRDHVATARRRGGVAEGVLHPPGVDRRGRRPFLDGDLRHLLTAERRDAPGHAGPVDQLPDQQQLRDQCGELVPREVGVPAASQRSARPSSTAPAAPSCPACRARSAARPRSRSPAWAPAPSPCAP